MTTIRDELLDRLAIREVIDQYFYALGRHDADAFVDCFTPTRATRRRTGMARSGP